MAVIRHDAVARLWAFRAHAELDAAARFARLERALVRFSAVPVVVDLAGQAALDERRHHVRCAELADRFGRPVASCNEAQASPLHGGQLEARDQLLYEVVAMSCVTESLSTALLLRMRAEAEDPAVRSVVKEILRDEVQHARLGWAHLAAESQRRSVTFLGPRLRGMLATTVDEEIFGEELGAGEALAPFGGLSRATRCEIFVSTMHQVVFGGLHRFGVDTTDAQRWLDQRSGRSRRNVARSASTSRSGDARR